MASVYKHIRILLFSLGIIGSFWVFEAVNIGPLYADYRERWEYRTMHPEFLPTSRFIKISSAGHETAYASSLWISLIQYIGDNIRNRGFDVFAPTILSRIHDLHPSFPRPYEFSLVILPTIFSDQTGSVVETKRKYVRETLNSLESRLGAICDQDKIRAILRVEKLSDIWEKPELADPCRNGQIPYYMAFHYYNDLGMSQKAQDYYKVSSAQTDVPVASRYLIGLMDANAGDYTTAAYSLSSLALGGDDDERGVCLEDAVKVSNILAKSKHEGRYTQEEISELMQIEKNLFDHPLKVTSQTPTVDCRTYLSRSIKQSFLGYIDERAEAMKLATGVYPVNSDDIQKAGFLSLIPEMSDSKGYIYKYQPTTKTWEYQMRIVK